MYVSWISLALLVVISISEQSGSLCGSALSRVITVSQLLTKAPEPITLYIVLPVSWLEGFRRWEIKNHRHLLSISVRVSKNLLIFCNLLMSWPAKNRWTGSNITMSGFTISRAAPNTAILLASTRSSLSLGWNIRLLFCSWVNLIPALCSWVSFISFNSAGSFSA